MERPIAILTISDTRTQETDLGGPAVEAALRELGYASFIRMIVRDEIAEIQQALRALSDQSQAVFTTGGTGFSPRDVTPEATAPLLDKRADNLCELMRLKGLEQTPLSYLSRGIAGIRGTTLIVNLPGSPRGAAFSVQAIGLLVKAILGECVGPA